MKNRSSGCFRRFLLIGILGGSFLCILLVGVSYLSNLLLPSHTENTSLLSELDKARLAEAIHLRQTLGDSVWPGWGKAYLAHWESQGKQRKSAPRRSEYLLHVAEPHGSVT